MEYCLGSLEKPWNILFNDQEHETICLVKKKKKKKIMKKKKKVEVQILNFYKETSLNTIECTSGVILLSYTPLINTTYVRIKCKCVFIP